MANKRKNGRGNQLPKQRNFKEITGVIENHIITKKIKNRRKDKKFKPVYFELKSAQVSGPYIKEKKKKSRINWILWAFNNEEDFLSKLPEVFLRNNLNFENFQVEICSEKDYITFQEIDLGKVLIHPNDLDCIQKGAGF